VDGFSERGKINAKLDITEQLGQLADEVEIAISE